MRDCVMILPFAQLLPLARRAFAAAGGWMPRIETTRTLTASLGPPAPAASGEISFDPALDALVARQTLARQRWAADWSRRDRRGFERAAARVVAAAHAVARALAAVPPGERAARVEQARAALAPPAGPGTRERLLAHLALEWGARAPAPATDRLFDLAAAGWIVVEAGGADPLVAALLDAGRAPALVIATDAPADEPFRDVGAEPLPALALCASFEDEASAAAAQILVHLDRGERPVALIAQDRTVVRRIRALLERDAVGLRDETGWRLSTTRAGASVMSVLAAARPGASTDAFFEWLKGTAAGRGDSRTLDRIESACRRRQVRRLADIGALELDPSAASLRADALALLARLAASARRSLPAWLDALAEVLGRTGVLEALREDPAGRQALEALAIDPAPPPEQRRLLEADLDLLSLSDFTHWVDEVLEERSYLPPDSLADAAAASAGAASPIDVVVTPLARAMLRPFAAVIVPGADASHLGASPVVDSLLPRAAAQALGLATPERQRDAERAAFAQALRLPRVTLLRRRADGAEPIADSPLVERLRLALAERGAALHEWADPRPVLALEPAPVRRGGPAVAPARLPARLSASAYEALRACPYRFFARSVLDLREVDELDTEVAKRDYGTWLHEVLHEFHATAPDTAVTRGDAIASLHAIGEAARSRAGIDAADFLPFAASFEAFVPRYVDWLAAREQGGAHWSRGEVEIEIAPPELAGTRLHGRIDRIDTVRIEGRPGLELIDYKTGSASRLKEQIRNRFEDTQLAFYAALMRAGPDLPMRAMYLALDATAGIEEIAHDEVAASADALVAGAAGELARLRAGAAMRPLGEGEACTYCLARGLCRRDHWSVEESAPDGAQPRAG